MLNDKCVFCQSIVIFWGSQISGEGTKPINECTIAIQDMPAPQNATEYGRFLGMANQLGKYSSTLAEESTPLRKLLVKNAAWIWGPAHIDAFEKIKDTLCSSEVLALYDPQRSTIVTAHASSHGLGAALLQTQPNGSTRPITHASI